MLSTLVSLQKIYSFFMISYISSKVSNYHVMLLWSYFILHIVLLLVYVDPHFSRAPPLDRRDSLFICEKLILEKLESPPILFLFWRENKTKKKNPKKWLHSFGKSMSLRNPSLGLGIRLLIGKVPLGGSTPLSPIKISTN